MHTEKICFTFQIKNPVNMPRVFRGESAHHDISETGTDIVGCRKRAGATGAEPPEHVEFATK